MKKYTGIAILVTALIIGAVFLITKNQLMNHSLDWLNLLIRWAHVIIGIGWIGASFYFIFLENSLNRSKNLRDELAGNLWAIHGGGFYYLEKYKVAPKEIPDDLHWFKYEAYFTWITGMLLLAIVYYANAQAYLIDTLVMDLSPFVAVSISLMSFVFGWFIYNGLCRTSLVDRRPLFALIGFILVSFMAYFYAHLFSGRAAYIHLGALIGTLMAGNVFFVIIPAQKALVKASLAGKLVEPKLGQHAGLRSLHNNYMTLPVVFIMISNHFPMTFAHQANWLILLGLTLASVAVRHYLNMREKGKTIVWLLPAALILLLGLGYMTLPPEKPSDTVGDTLAVSPQRIEKIIQQRCQPCHSAFPSDEGWSSAPKGLVLDSLAQVLTAAPLIKKFTVETEFMPLGNKTNMTRNERKMLASWLEKAEKNQ